MSTWESRTSPWVASIHPLSEPSEPFVQENIFRSGLWSRALPYFWETFQGCHEEQIVEWEDPLARAASLGLAASSCASRRRYPIKISLTNANYSYPFFVFSIIPAQFLFEEIVGGAVGSL